MRTVLLVEDNPGDAELVRQHLAEIRSRHPIDIQHVLSLAEAVEALDHPAKAIDACVLDLGLPDGQGVSNVESLRTQHPTLPIVVFTGMNDESTGRACLQAGAQDYLDKDHATGPLLARTIDLAIERCAGEQERERHRRRLAAFVESVPVGFVAFGGQGDVFLINRRAESFLEEYAPSAGQPVTKLLAMLETAPGGRHLAEAARSRRAATGEMCVQTATAKRWLAIDVTPIEVPADDRTVVLSMLDVTEARRMEAHVRTTQRLEAVGRLAGGIAHDFNNILSVIVGFGEFALSAAKDSGQREDLERVLDAGRRGSALTADLLSFAKQRHIEPAPVVVDDALRGLVPLLRRAAGFEIAVGTQLTAGDATVFTGPTALDQVLMNLVVNAADAMPDGGSISIETKRTTVAQGGLVCVPDRVPAGEYVLIVVQDTGQGMSPETVDRIFEPFFSTKEGKGTGLGLATCYGLVKQSGGALGVTSAVGVGTTFSVFLPCIADKLPRGTDLDRSDRVDVGGNETILVAEDNPDVRRVVSRVLSQAGYAVLEASSGAEAILVGERHEGPIDLLLSDIVMPYLSGTEVAERLGATRPGIPVLFMSGFFDVDVAPEGRVLQKPFTPAQLLEAVRDVIDGSSSDAEMSPTAVGEEGRVEEGLGEEH